MKRLKLVERASNEGILISVRKKGILFNIIFKRKGKHIETVGNGILMIFCEHSREGEKRLKIVDDTKRGGYKRNKEYHVSVSRTPCVYD